MKKLSITVVGAAASLLLSACADGYLYGPPAPYAGVAYSGYYDDYYGPFYGGYWGPGGYFYYADRDGQRYHRDSGRHFRRDQAPGYHAIQGHAPQHRTDRPRP